jgi:hypothetical protein
MKLMRTLFITIFLLSTLIGRAQTGSKASIQKAFISFHPIASISRIEDTPIVKDTNEACLVLSTTPYYSCIRASYRVVPLSYEFIWPVNKLAGTYMGVDSRNGEVPNIKGARQDGTAYFIDGVRVRSIDYPVENYISTLK